MHKVGGACCESSSGVLVKGIIYRLRGELFGWKWRWGSDLVNDENRIKRVDVLYVT